MCYSWVNEKVIEGLIKFPGQCYTFRLCPPWIQLWNVNSFIPFWCLFWQTENGIAGCVGTEHSSDWIIEDLFSLRNTPWIATLHLWELPFQFHLAVWSHPHFLWHYPLVTWEDHILWSNFTLRGWRLSMDLGLHGHPNLVFLIKNLILNPKFNLFV